MKPSTSTWSETVTMYFDLREPDLNLVLMTDIEDMNTFAYNIQRLCGDPTLRERPISQAHKEVTTHREYITRRYFEKLYRPCYEDTHPPQLAR